MEKGILQNAQDGELVGIIYGPGGGIVFQHLLKNRKGKLIFSKNQRKIEWDETGSMFGFVFHEATEWNGLSEQNGMDVVILPHVEL